MRRGFAWSSSIVVLLVASASSAWAVDLSASGFGTLGYARSNVAYGYQRFIDDDGTFKRDSVAGVQVDAKINNEFAATVQVKAAAATDSDRRYEGSVSWAFLSYRPTNDLLIRIGKQRSPLYLFSETYDVGVTYDFLRLPTEMYSITSNNESTGVSFSKSWKVADGEFSLDGIVGTTTDDFRYWFRDGIRGTSADQSVAKTAIAGYDQGALFQKLDFRGGGFVLGYKDDENTFRASVFRVIVRAHGGGPLIAGYSFVGVAPGIGYYQTSPSLPGPGIPTVDSVVNTTFTLGADVALPANFRFIGEFARSVVPDSLTAPKANRGYGALLRRIGKWTPYVTYAFLKSPQAQRDFYNAIDQSALPAFIPGASTVNAAQKSGADGISVYHQTSWALGTSYSFSATSKLKGEFLRTRVGDVSKEIDAPSGGDTRNKNINVLSLSYSVVY